MDQEDQDIDHMEVEAEEDVPPMERPEDYAQYESWRERYQPKPEDPQPAKTFISTVYLSSAKQFFKWITTEIDLKVPKEAKKKKAEKQFCLSIHLPFTPAPLHIQARDLLYLSLSPHEFIFCWCPPDHPAAHKDSPLRVVYQDEVAKRALAYWLSPLLLEPDDVLPALQQYIQPDHSKFYEAGASRLCAGITQLKKVFFGRWMHRVHRDSRSRIRVHRPNEPSPPRPPPPQGQYFPSRYQVVMLLLEVLVEHAAGRENLEVDKLRDRRLQLRFEYYVPTKRTRHGRSSTERRSLKSSTRMAICTDLLYQERRAVCALARLYLDLKFNTTLIKTIYEEINENVKLLSHTLHRLFRYIYLDYAVRYPPDDETGRLLTDFDHSCPNPLKDSLYAEVLRCGRKSSNFFLNRLPRVNIYRFTSCPRAYVDWSDPVLQRRELKADETLYKVYFSQWDEWHNMTSYVPSHHSRAHQADTFELKLTSAVDLPESRIRREEILFFQFQYYTKGRQPPDLEIVYTLELTYAEHHNRYLHITSRNQGAFARLRETFVYWFGPCEKWNFRIPHTDLQFWKNQYLIDEEEEMRLCVRPFLNMQAQFPCRLQGNYYISTRQALSPDRFFHAQAKILYNLQLRISKHADNLAFLLMYECAFSLPHVRTIDADIDIYLETYIEAGWQLQDWHTNAWQPIQLYKKHFQALRKYASFDDPQ